MSTPFWHSLIIAQQQAKVQTSSPPQQQAQPINAQQNSTQTRIFSKTNHTVIGAIDVISITGTGTIEEVLFKSPSADFSIVLNVDNQPEYQQTWTELSVLSDDLDAIIATKRASTYIMHLSSIHFSNKASLILSGPNITFSSIYARCSYVK